MAAFIAQSACLQSLHSLSSCDNASCWYQGSVVSIALDAGLPVYHEQPDEEHSSGIAVDYMS